MRPEAGSEQEKLAFPPPAALFLPGCDHTLAEMITICKAALSLLGDDTIAKGPDGSSLARYPSMSSKESDTYRELRMDQDEIYTLAHTCPTE